MMEGRNELFRKICAAVVSQPFTKKNKGDRGDCNNCRDASLLSKV